jgi:hypothetical protein
MNLSMHNQTLLRGILAGAVVLSGASACSRSDRAGTGRDTTQSGATVAVPSDSQTSANAPQPSAGAATQPSGDTATATAQTQPPRQRTTPSSRRARQDTTVKSGEAAVSGYREMEQDTSAQDTLAAAANRADTAGVSSDTSVSVSTAAPDSASPESAPTGAASPLDSAGVTSDYALTGDTTSADTTSAGYSEMARDTNSAAGRGDTAAVAVADTTTPAESDTAGIKVQMDTTRTDTLKVATADSADTASTRSEPAAAQVANADTLQDNSGRIRPPEDSTEIQGNVTTDSARVAGDNVATQSETERIRPPEDSTEIRGNVTDAAGAAPTGGTVTGIDAVSLMSRAGARCVVKDDSGDVWWDMADSPAALNPCGTGTMTLSLVRTGEK